MPKPHFCHTCIYYEKNIFTRTGESFGICHNTGVATKVALDGKSQIEEEGTFYTEQYFGCIYWRENDGVLIDISDVVKRNIIEKKAKEITGESAKELSDNFPDITCKNCGAANCYSNSNCIKCNCQL